MSNINDTYFDGYYKDIWKALIPDVLTSKEVGFMVQYFELNTNSKVLDLMCGYGRHALALGEKGIGVIAVDNLGEYIREVEKESGKGNWPVKAVQTDILEFTTSEQFDLVICMGNSLNFFDANDCMRLFSRIHSWLKPYGKLLINSWSLAEIAIREFVEKSEGTINEMKMVTTSRYLFQPTRIESETSISLPGGEVETKMAVDYIYSISEMEAMLNSSGFQLKEIYSIPGRKKFTIGEPRAYLIAEKNSDQSS